jgi:hypothetical protein
MLMRRPRPAGCGPSLPLLAALAVVWPLGWMWASSFVPSRYSATGHGLRRRRRQHRCPVDTRAGHATRRRGVPVASADRRRRRTGGRPVTLVARQERFRSRRARRSTATRSTALARADAARPAGQAARGAAGQRVGRRRDDPALARRRRAERGRRRGRGDPGRGAGRRHPRLPLPAAAAGTYWYHAHQLSHDQVERGLLGALVVDPGRRPRQARTRTVVAPDPRLRRQAHRRGRTGDVPVPPRPARPCAPRDQHRQRARRRRGWTGALPRARRRRQRTCTSRAGGGDRRWT